MEDCAYLRRRSVRKKAIIEQRRPGGSGKVTDAGWTERLILLLFSQFVAQFFFFFMPIIYAVISI